MPLMGAKEIARPNIKNILVSLISFGALAVSISPSHAEYGPRPKAWCGWQMRQEVWRDPGPAFNRAAEWKKFGRPANGPAVGVIVVWSRGKGHGHVGKIVGQNEAGEWIVRSGNDGRSLRERARSFKGVVAYRWPW